MVDWEALRPPFLRMGAHWHPRLNGMEAGLDVEAEYRVTQVTKYKNIHTIHVQAAPQGATWLH